LEHSVPMVAYLSTKTDQNLQFFCASNVDLQQNVVILPSGNLT
jgi:hypothetical protein